jgi:zinc protease
MSAFPGLTPAPVPAPAAAMPAGPEISRFQLANGLDVVVIPDRRVPVATHMVWYRVGSADEPAGRSGIAHFLEHLMFKGTDKHPAGEFSNVVSEIGGQENAFTGNDYTAYFQRVAKEHLGTVMAFEADRMTGLQLTDDVVLPERNVVLEEQNTRVANEPAAQLGEELAAALFRNHPYSHPIIGWRHEIETLSREDALSMYRRFYAPNNAILVVAGDVEPDEVKALADATYGAVPRQPAP